MIKKIAVKLNFDVKPELVIVKTVEEATQYRHIGGPTIQVNGLDIEPNARHVQQFAMA
jgi:hypothetical protein